jgi:hypothetical protein
MADAYTSSTANGQKTNGGIVNRVKETAAAQLAAQKDRGTDALGRVADAVRSSTQRLRDEQHDTIAGYVDKAADQIETWSRRLREKDVEELVADVQQLARRRPAVFIGSAFALGVVGARFLKSSRPQPQFQYDERHDESEVSTEFRTPGADIGASFGTSPSATGATERGTRSNRGRRSTLRTEQ